MRNDYKMTRLSWPLFLACALLTCSLLTSRAHAEANKHWQRLLEKDLKHIYTTVKQNHPGYLDTANPYFKQWLQRGYKEGLKRAKTVKSLSDVFNALRIYAAGFADVHFSVDFYYHTRWQYWAGMQIEKRGQYYYVTQTQEHWPVALPPVSSRLISCDNRPIAELLNHEILPYRFSQAELEFPKIQFASRLTIDDGIGYRTRYKSCQFLIDDKQEQTFALHWQSFNGKLPRQGKPADYEVSEVEQGVYWVRIPTFAPNAQQLVSLKRVLEQLRQLEQAKRIVLDVRGNQGGNSGIGQTLLVALYGESIFKYAAPHHADEYPVWRISADNYHYRIITAIPQMKREVGEDHAFIQVMVKDAQRMKHALRQGEPLLELKPNPEDYEQAPKKTKKDNEVKARPPLDPNIAKPILLTDIACISACMDFADWVLAIPTALQVGQQTRGDTLYTSIRKIELPSKLGYFNLAQKMIRNRPREHNQSYRPDIEYPGDLKDTQALKTWVNATLLSHPP